MLGRDERAFELLVRRHAHMVMATVRHVLRDTHDADDAFQVTFLTLATSADKLRCKAAVGGWLHGIAQRCALKTRENVRQVKGSERAYQRREMSDATADKSAVVGVPSSRGRRNSFVVQRHADEECRTTSSFRFIPVCV